MGLRRLYTCTLDRSGVVSWRPEQYLYPHTMRNEPSSSWTARTSQLCAFQQEMATSNLDGKCRNKAGTIWQAPGKVLEAAGRPNEAPPVCFSPQRIIPAARTRDANTRRPAWKPVGHTLITRLARTAATDWLSSTPSFLHSQDKRCRFLRRQVIMRFHTPEACTLLVFTGQDAR